ncbi:hypothetical protein ACE102_03095 [Bradyrhizobium sp. vgs-9]|uniref:hypothetical protein n=1 Tax=Bradyrhizobium sp. vgs-9 TaxID=208389 RepID=UPI0035D442A3
MKLPTFSTAHYTAIVSTLAFLASGVVGLYFTKLGHDLNVRKEERELHDKEPTVDIAVRPNHNASSADIAISILNRGDIMIVPQDIIVLPSFEWGEFYLSGPGQSLDLLRSTLSLRSMGTILPKAVGTVKGIVAGVTDGKDDSFKSGVELQFVVRLRLGDEQGTVRVYPLVRQVGR